MQIKIENKAEKRIKGKIKYFKKILLNAKERDVNESDTVTIIVDILVEIFGYNRYTEITKEYSIKGTYCDLAVKIDNVLKILIEVKSIGVSLKDEHIRQATNYGAREGVSWVVLTNGIEWKIYCIEIKDSIKIKPLVNFNLLDDRIIDNYINEIYSLCREGIKKSAIEKIYEYQSFVNKYCIASILASEEVKKIITKNIKKLSKGAKIESNDIDAILTNEIIKRDIVDSDEFRNYIKKNKNLLKKKDNKQTRKTSDSITNSDINDT